MVPEITAPPLPATTGTTHEPLPAPAPAPDPPPADPSAAPFPPPPILTTPRLLLRPLHPLDAPSLASEGNDPRVASNMSNAFPHPYTTAAALFFLDLVRTSPDADGSRHHYAIAYVSAPDRLIGVIGLKPLADFRHRTRELGYWLGAAHWGRGLMTEAVREFCRWAFDHIPGMRRIDGNTFGPNQGSVKVLQKAGFTLEGVRRMAGEKQGVVFDLNLLGLLREECEGVKSKVTTE